MILNDEQKAMLNGDLGEGAAYAMKIQFALGEAFDAKRMVPIKRAHVALSNQDGDLWFAEKLVKAGAHCKVAPTVNPASAPATSPVPAVTPPTPRTSPT